jgi:hypothetical protein
MRSDQRDASAGGDIVGRDKTVHVHFPVNQQPSKLAALKARLQNELTNGDALAVLDKLQRFAQRVPADGISGLEAKLEHSDRASHTMRALEMKEQFAKLLEAWSLYASAQDIFVHLLTKVDLLFDQQIRPLLSELGVREIDELTEKLIVTPIIDECGIEVFDLDYHTAMGMIYWLADRCYVSWHK